MSTAVTDGGESQLQWLYIDQQGQTQGPFADDKMRAWMAANYFTLSTKVKLPHEADFRELKDHPQSFAQQKSAPPPPYFPPQEQTPEQPALPSVSAPLPPSIPPPPLEDNKDVSVPSASALSTPAPEDFEWLYLDDDGVEQGPFAHAQMQEWFAASFFTGDTKVRAKHQPDATFVPIKDRKDCLFAGQKVASANAAATLQTPSLSISGLPSALPLIPSLPLMPPVALPPVPVVLGKTRWFYLDDEDSERGPWSEKQMKLWCSKGFFDHSNEDGSVKVRKEGESIFRSLAEWQGPLPGWALGHLPPKKVPGISNRMDMPLLPPLATLPLGARPPLPIAPFPFGMLPPPPMLLPGQPEPEWTYLDKDGVEQGPWSSQQMRQWYSGGLLSPQVRVREKGSLAPWTPIGARPCCFTGPPPIGSAAPPPPPGPSADAKEGATTAAGRGGFPITSYPGGPPPAWLMNRTAPAPAPPAPVDYAQTAAFSGNNRFSTAVAGGQAPATHWEKRGLAPDSAGRQMAHYFDFDKWQEERNKASQKRKAAEE